MEASSVSSAARRSATAVFRTFTFQQRFQDRGEAFRREQTFLDVFDDETIELGHRDMPAQADGPSFLVAPSTAVIRVGTVASPSACAGHAGAAASTGGEPCEVTRSSIDRGMAARSPNTAKHFLYALRGLFQWGMKAQHCAHDPTAGLKPIQQHSDGHPVWPEAWCRQHEAYWPLGTQQRLDYDLLPVWRRWPLSMTLHRSSGVPSLLLSRCYVTASALAQPLWRLRRYQSSPLLECVKRAGRINAWRSSTSLITRSSSTVVNLVRVCH